MRVAALCLLGVSAAACRRESAAGASQQAEAPPTLRLLVVTDLAGVLEPCGCSPRSRGGIDRLAVALEEARAAQAPSLLLLSGPTLFEAAEMKVLPLQERWEAAMIAELLRDLRADAALPGASDVAQAGEDLEALAQRAGFPWLLGAREPAPGPFLSNLQRDVAGLKVALLGAAFEPTAAAPGSGARALLRLQRDVARARQAGADLVIVLANGATPALEAALERSGADLLIAGGELRAQALPVRRAGEGVLLNAGRHGEQLLIVDLWWSGKQLPLALGRPSLARAPAAHWLSTQLVTLERAAPRAPAVERKLQSLAKKINGFNASAYAARAPQQPIAGAAFAGSQPCAACHTAAYLWWRGSAHGRAYATLQKLDKEYNLDCVACHVTGYGEPGGASVARVEGLEGAGCESCHGAAAAHVDDPRAAPRPRREVVGGACRSCHDREHSPEFDERSYRDKLKAPGHGAAVTRRQ